MRSTRWTKRGSTGASVLLALASACGCDGGADSASDAAVEAAAAPRGYPDCPPPPDCQPVNTLALELKPCCTTLFRCGYELTRPAQLRSAVADDAGISPDNPEGRCIQTERIFNTPATPGERRIERGPEPIFYTPECTSRGILAYPFNGCCMPSGECGLSTDVAFNALDVLAFPSASPITRIECTTARKINEAFSSASIFAGFAHLQETSGRCDYAGLAARNPPIPKD